VWISEALTDRYLDAAVRGAGAEPGLRYRWTLMPLDGGISILSQRVTVGEFFSPPVERS
jgi:hypothetical protein